MTSKANAKLQLVAVVTSLLVVIAFMAGCSQPAYVYDGYGPSKGAYTDLELKSGENTIKFNSNGEVSLSGTWTIYPAGAGLNVAEHFEDLTYSGKSISGKLKSGGFEYNKRTYGTGDVVSGILSWSWDSEVLYGFKVKPMKQDFDSEKDYIKGTITKPTSQDSFVGTYKTDNKEMRIDSDGTTRTFENGERTTGYWKYNSTYNAIEMNEFKKDLDDSKRTISLYILLPNGTITGPFTRAEQGEKVYFRTSENPVTWVK